MVCASRLAERRGLIPSEVTDRQLALLRHFGLPTERDAGWDVRAILDVMRRDKKNVGGHLRFILPTRFGEVAVFDDIPEADALAVLTAR
jgi:3-dehydroquinate synthase